MSDTKDLSGANLYEANLSGANLRGANLRGAIMPDGRQYEDWLALIDAGSDLPEACKAVDGVLQEYIEFLDERGFGNDDEVDVKVQIAAAIAKAEAES